MKIPLILLAGGIGSRIHSSIPKQFIDVLGKPLILHTLDKIEKCVLIDCIYVVCNADYMELMEKIIQNNCYTKQIIIIPGGETGLESTYNGIKAVPQTYQCVMIHDGNRPIVDNDIFYDCIRTYNQHGNAVAAIKSVELLYKSDNGISSCVYVDRETVWKTHTPQLYDLSEVKQMYDVSFKDGDPGYASTTEMYVKNGKSIFFSESKANNIKITYPEDFELLEALLIINSRFDC